MLTMKDPCEKCGAATGLTDVAYICSFECTFCEACTTSMKGICPNCSGDLVLRPTRTRRPVAVAASLAAKRFRGARK